MKIKDESLEQFLVDVKNRFGDDFTNYNYSTIKRRIEIHCIKLNVDSFYLYTQYVLNSQETFDEMFTHFSINVTEFFREPDQLKIFKDEVIPYLQTFPYLKIWCAGCSTGEEAYSISILLEEAGVLDKCQVYATDFNNKVLDRAKNGLFDISHFDVTSEQYKSSGGEKNLEDYFVKKGKFFQIKKRLKEKILFFNHNLVTDGVMNNFQLIVCKNVVIYFNKNLKDTVLDKFSESLKYNGFMILGNSEYLPEKFEEQFKLYSNKSKVYQKKC